MELGSTPRQLAAQLAIAPCWNEKSLSPSNVKHYLCVHTEVHIHAEPRSSHQHARVDGFASEGVDDISEWKRCGEIASCASAGPVNQEIEMY